MSAFSERRFLVEGWGYLPHNLVTADELDVWVGLAPFWDQELLAANDAAFTSPDQQTLARLWRMGVRWLMVDRAWARESDSLRQLASLRYENGPIAIYRLPAP
jgi:hypothetical protein